MAWYSHVAKRYSASEAPAATKDLKVKRAGIAFVTGGGGSGSRAQFEDPPIDFEEIQSAYNSDGYIRQALDKYIYLMFKEGYKITSKNVNAAEYIRQRINLMALGCDSTPNEMFVEIASTLAKYANVFIIKARQDVKVKLKGVNIKPAPGMSKNIAGYFVQNPSTVTIARDVNGNIQGYKITVNGAGSPIEVKTDNMIHIFYDKEPGMAFAIPFVWEVLDDVKLLRQLEETAANMVHKETYPLRDVSVGSDQEGQWASEEEITDAKTMIESIESDGWVIHGSHIKVQTLGGQGEALDAVPYLGYYEARVFSGLGVSAVMMGRGEGASRSTADNMTDQMFDRILGLQRVLADNISWKMFYEMLLEGGFDPLNNPDDMVTFEFNPVDRNQTIKNELHELQKFQSNLVSFDEARQNIKLDPIEDTSRFYTFLFKIPEITAQAEAQASVNAASGAGTGNGSQAAVDNKNRPANQNGKKTGPSRAKNSTESFVFEKAPAAEYYFDYFEKQFEFLRDDLTGQIKSYYKSKDKSSPGPDFGKDISLVINLASENIKKQGNRSLLNVLVRGSEEARMKIDQFQMPNIAYTEAMVRVDDTIKNDVERVISDVKNLAVAAASFEAESDALSRLNAALDSVKYRTSFIVRTEAHRAYNYGFALCAKAFGMEEVKVIADCETCKAAYPGSIKLSGDFYNEIPPSAHPNCDCQIDIA